MITHKDCSSFPCDTTWNVAQNPEIYVMFNSYSWATATFDWEFNFEIMIGNAQQSTEIQIDTISVNEVDSNGNKTNITQNCSIAGTNPRPVNINGVRGSKYNIIAICPNIRPQGNREYMLVKVKPVNGTYVGAVKINSGTRTWSQDEVNTGNDDVVNSINSSSRTIKSAIDRMKQEVVDKLNQITGDSSWQNQNYNSQSYSSTSPNSNNNTMEGAEGDLENNYGIGDGTISGYGQGAFIHSNASEFIWTTIRKCIDNTALFTLIITILFLGVIATMLNR